MASRARKRTKTGFTVNRVVLDLFMDYMKKLGLRRDQYLNRVLPFAVGEFKGAARNSEVGRLILEMQQKNRNAMKKLSVTLDDDVLKNLNAVCRDKRVPRDCFVEEFLRFLTYDRQPRHEAPLLKAAGLLVNPFMDWAPEDGENAFDDIIYEDLTKQDLILALKSRNAAESPGSDKGEDQPCE